MTTYAWPAALRPSAFEAQLVPNVRSFSSPYGGASQALDLLGERWRFALELPACMPHESGVREALFTKLRGGAHRVSLHHMARPQPVGTLRGLPTLKTTAAQGASSIVLAGCTGLNLLYRAGFEADGDADGMADGFSQYNSGTTGGITSRRDPSRARQRGPGGPCGGNPGRYWRVVGSPSGIRRDAAGRAG